MESIANAIENGGSAQAKEKHERLQVLVGELLSDNQKLRFQVAQLEAQAEKAEKGLAEASRWSSALF